MIRKENLLKTLVLAFVLGFSVVGCSMDEIIKGAEGEKENPIDLTIDKWTRGTIVKSNDGGNKEQWFKFVASTSTQYIYTKLSTSTSFYVYLYDSDNYQIGTQFHAGGYGSSAGRVEIFSRVLNSGETYYIKVTGNEGNFWIGFTGFPFQPETVVTELSTNTWTTGNIIKQDNGGTGEQWFSFVATSTTQHYLYSKFGSSIDIYAYLYDSNFYQIGNRYNFYGSNKKASWLVTGGETYYIKVNGNEGNFWIAFNTTGNAPN
ncbi:MAG: hypothetical protein K5930_12995 [Treponemataceae bacterium]|nr:hypothetical protein [Treponemataceae bacterium]